MKSFTDQVRDWAAKKSANETYDYSSNDNCALCQFLRENGYAEHPRVGGDYWRAALSNGGYDGPEVTLDDRLRNALHARTFGELAERLSA